jgi:hypothetical protein
MMSGLWAAYSTHAAFLERSGGELGGLLSVERIAVHQCFCWEF